MSTTIRLGKKSTAKEVLDAFGTGKYLDGKTAIVTGGNSGIGLELCKVLAHAGCRVILCSRSVSAARKAIDTEIKLPGLGKYTVEDTTNIIVKELDLNELKSVKSFAEDIISTESRIDFLVLNAGIMALPRREVTTAGFEKQIGVNHFGHAFLTSLLLDKMKAQDFNSRVVVVSSSMHGIGRVVPNDLHFKERSYGSWLAYGQSKLANVMFAKGLAERTRGTKVTAVSLHPGIISTPLYREQGFIGFFSSFFADKNIPQGASTTAWACLSPRVDGDDFRGAYLSDCGPAMPAASADNQSVIDALWETTFAQLSEATQS